MILADILSISIKLLLVVHVLVSLLLILVVLMQRPKQEGLGAAFGGGVTDSVFGAQTTNVLQKATVYLGSLFMLLSLVLAILIGNKNHQSGVTAEVPPAIEEAPAVPGTGADGESLVEELEKAEEETPAPVEEEPAEEEPTGEEPAEGGAVEGEPADGEPAAEEPAAEGEGADTSAAPEGEDKPQ